MARLRRHLPRLLICVLAATSLASVAAAEETPGLHDRPVLAIDPGMHTAPIIRADVDAAGRLAVTGSRDRTVRVWRVADGALLRTIRMPTGPGIVGNVYAVAISPDGGTVAAGGWTRSRMEDREEQIYLFDTASGRMTGRLGGLPNVVHHLAFSPDGTRLAATLGVGGMRLYGREADGGWTERARDADYADESYGVAFAADGRFATTSFDGRLRLYDPGGGLIASADSGFDNPFGLAFNPEDGRLAVGFIDTTAVRLFDGSTLAPLLPPDTAGIDYGYLFAVAWSANGGTLFAAGQLDVAGENPVVAWDDDGVRQRLPGSETSVMSLKPLSDGGLLVAAQDPFVGVLGADGGWLWDPKRPVQMDPRGQFHTFSVSADGMVLDFGFDYGGERRARFDVAALALTLDPAVGGPTAPPRQESLPVENWINTFRPTLDGTPLPLRKREPSRSFAIDPDGARFLLGTEYFLRAFDRTGAELWRHRVSSVAWAVNITRDGRLAVAAYGDGTIRWHRMDNGAELLALYPFADGTERFVVWTPEG